MRLPILAANVDSASEDLLGEHLDEEPADEEPLRFGRMLRCPWCETWAPQEAFLQLQSPDNYPQQCPPIYKHGGPDGCKSLFSLAEYAPSTEGVI